MEFLRTALTNHPLLDHPDFQQFSLAPFALGATITVHSKTLSSSGLGHRPFTAVTRVRIPLGSPVTRQAAQIKDLQTIWSCSCWPKFNKKFNMAEEFQGVLYVVDAAALKSDCARSYGAGIPI
jgi:hypothetical protein